MTEPESPDAAIHTQEGLSRAPRRRLWPGVFVSGSWEPAVVREGGPAPGGFLYPLNASTHFIGKYVTPGRTHVLPDS